jgi:DNA-binding IclR family transcriptional regulator
MRHDIDMLATETDSGVSGETGPSVLGRAFRVLDSLPPDGTGITLTDLAMASEVPKGSLHRMLGQLLELEVLRREGDQYRLGRHLFALTRRTDPDHPLREAAMPFMLELQAKTSRTVHLAVLDGTDVLYVERVGDTRSSTLPTRAGDRMPSYCTGLGKALLAFCATPETVEHVLGSGLRRRTPRTLSMPGLLARDLRRTRAAGFAQDREESVPGLSCVAMPIPGPDGAVAALSVSGATSRDNDGLPRQLRFLHAASEGIARALETPVSIPA